MHVQPDRFEKFTLACRRCQSITNYALLLSEISLLDASPRVIRRRAVEAGLDDQDWQMHAARFGIKVFMRRHAIAVEELRKVNVEVVEISDRHALVELIRIAAQEHDLPTIEWNGRQWITAHEVAIERATAIHDAIARCGTTIFAVERAMATVAALPMAEVMDARIQREGRLVIQPVHARSAQTEELVTIAVIAERCHRQPSTVKKWRLTPAITGTGGSPGRYRWSDVVQARPKLTAGYQLLHHCVPLGTNY